MRFPAALRCRAAASVLLLAPGTAGAADLPVDLELVLAVDISRSIDAEEARLQRLGYASALTNPRVLAAIRSGFLGRIAVTYVEWAGIGSGSPAVGWSVIADADDAAAFAGALVDRPPISGRRTSISRAIDSAAALFAGNGYQGTRRIIDISGDGPNNQGAPVTEARDRAVAAGITINGLPIINDRPSPFGWPNLPDLDLYFENCVIGGPAAFIVVAEGFEAFAEAIRSKLILEIAGAAPARPPLVSVADRRAPPCDIGERLWRQRQNFP